MRNEYRIVGSKLLGLAALVLTLAVCASAQNTVYVAFNGLDTNPCTRAAQCKTITHALTVVPAGGVVDITASGSYDTFTINKAVSVEADLGVDATITVPAAGTGVSIDGGASDTVIVKRLSLWGSGANAIGIQVNSGATAVLEDCVSRNLHFGASLNSTTTAIKVTGGVYEGSDTSLILRAGANKVVIDGVKIYGTSSNAAVDAVGDDIAVTHSLLSGSGTTGFNPGVWIKGGATVTLEYDVISGYGPGVQVGGGLAGNAVVFLSNNTITNNSTGVTVSTTTGETGTGFTRHDNTIAGNGTNVSGPLTGFAAQ